MPNFSKKSQERFNELHPFLQEILREAIRTVDFTILCAFRGEAEQEEAFRANRSRVRWPNSLHNQLPSLAVDVAPYPIDWKDLARFARLAGYLERIADEKGIRIRWGGDWNDNFRTADERLVDMPHIELVLK